MNFWKDAHRAHKSGLLCVSVDKEWDQSVWARQEKAFCKVPLCVKQWVCIAYSKQIKTKTVLSPV